MDVSKAILAETERRISAKEQGVDPNYDDPAALRARIAELEAQLAAATEQVETIVPTDSPFLDHMANTMKDVTPKEGN